MVSSSALVLITTASNPPEGVYALRMTNVATRKITAKAAVFFWAALGVQKIVIADATGQTLLDESDVLLLNQMGLEVEQVHYLQDNERVIEKGKGYGEGALIKFALEHSKLLQTVDHFFKSTGKVYCRNFFEIKSLIQKNKIQTIFWRDVHNPSLVDTRFFYATKKFTSEYLLPAYEQVDDKSNHFSEHCAMKMVRENLKQGASIRPRLSGFSGTFNKPYFDSSLGLLDQKFPCWVSQ
jgi:hypothetical protein